MFFLKFLFSLLTARLQSFRVFFKMFQQSLNKCLKCCNVVVNVLSFYSLFIHCGLLFCLCGLRYEFFCTCSYLVGVQDTSIDSLLILKTIVHLLSRNNPPLSSLLQSRIISLVLINLELKIVSTSMIE